MVPQDFVAEAISALKLVNDSAIDSLAAILPKCLEEHPRKLCTTLRKELPQVSVEIKKQLSLRKNGFLSVACYSQLTEHGLKEPLLAHEQTLLRAHFSSIHHTTLIAGRTAGYEYIKWSASHPAECKVCFHRDDQCLKISNVSPFPPSDCERRYCSAWIRPHRNWIEDDR
jgi:hypothetical protein